MPDTITLQNADLTVTLSSFGAELTSIRDASGAQWLWASDPATWPRQAPTLFPVIAQVHERQIRHRGVAYPMPPHGFAPASEFRIAEIDQSLCRLTLEATEDTRTQYPFEFRLELEFSLESASLGIAAKVINLGNEEMPSSVGFHPGFAWPLPTSADLPKGAHIMAFAASERPVIRRTESDGMLHEAECVPIQDRILALNDSLFAKGAMIFERIASRSFWYGAQGRPGIHLDLGTMPTLGVRSRPPGNFLCLEPWQGLPDPKGYVGELVAKPGTVKLAPGEHFTRRCRFTFGAPQPATTA